MDGTEADLIALWQQAVDSFGGHTDHALSSAAGKFRAIKTPDDLAAYIEESGAAFANFRLKHQRLWSTLKNFIAPISTMAGIAVTPSSVADFGIASSAILGAVAYLVKVCEGVSDAYDWIEHIIQIEMLEFSHRLTHYLSGPLDSVMQKKIVTILAVIFKLINRANYLVRKGRFRHYIHVMWLGKDVETKELVDRLNAEFGGEQRYTLGVTYVVTQRIRDTTKRTEENVKQITTDIRDVKLLLERPSRPDEDALLRRVLCDTTAHDDVEEIYAKNSKALLKGTGVWLETEPFFQSWITHQAAILWIFGRPGTGKTYLSTWIVKRLLEQPEDESSNPMAYFFVKEDNGNLRNANIILKTLAWQIAKQDQHFRMHVAAVCGQRIHTITAEDTWRTIFLDYYMSEGYAGRTATLIIDGLDEAIPETRRIILRLLKDLVPSHGARKSNIQFAVIGRPSLRGDWNVKRLEKSCIIEVATKNRRDVDQYIKKRLGDVQILWEMRRIKPDGPAKANKFGSMIFKRVSEGADGVFLWAKLLLDSLVHKDRRQIEAILVSPPSTLDDMIWHVFNRLLTDEDLDQDVIKRMLLFGTYAKRPLLFAELYAAISLPLRTPNYLLWKQTRGIMSSIFDLRFPDGIDPDVEDDADDGGDEHAVHDGGDPVEEDDDPFDFSHPNEDTERLDDNSAFNQGDFSQNSGSNEEYGNEGEGEDSRGEEAADEEDLLGCLTERQRMTEITFCHTRIRDYLEREGSLKRSRMPPQSVIPANEDAHADFTIACIELFRIEPYSVEDQWFLSDYPICYLTFHLQATDIDKIPREKATRILGGLYWLFGTEKGTKCLLKAAREYDDFRSYRDTFWQLWVETDHNLRLLQTWFRWAGALRSHAGWDEHAAIWMQAAAASLPDLLRPMMIAASKLWLRRPASESPEYFEKGEFAVWLMHGWLTRLETGTAPSLSLSFRRKRDFDTFELLSPERLETMANWAGFDHDVHWHSLLGWMLMSGKHYKAAESHCHEAIKLDPASWISLEALARSAGEQGRLQEAISWQRKGLAALTPSVADMAGWLWWRISDWAKTLGDKETRYLAARMGWEANDMSMPALETYIDVLNEHEEYDTVISTLEYLTRGHAYGYNLLTRFFTMSSWSYSVGYACRKQGKPPFVLDEIDKARKVGEVRLSKQDQLWQAQWMGRFIYYYYGLEEKAMPLFEAFLDRLRRQSDALQKENEDRRKEISSRLAQMYFDRMVESWSKYAGAQPLHADKLKKMAVAVSTGLGDGYEGFDLYQEDYPSMLWGRWMRDYLRADASEWKKCFRARLLEEMKMLDDDDLTNDTEGLAQLAVSLFHAGDRQNAGAILAILFKAAEDKPESGSELAGASNRTPEEPIASPAPSGSSPTSASTLPHTTPADLKLYISPTVGALYACASCDQAAPDVAELYLCEVCYRVGWCGECLVMLRGEGRHALNAHQCNPKHDFYRAWPIPEEAMYGAAQSFENGVTVRRAWFERLRREWLE